MGELSPEMAERVDRATANGNELAGKIIDWITAISPDQVTAAAADAGIIGLVNAVAFLVASSAQGDYTGGSRLWLYQEFVPAVIKQIEAYEKLNRVEH